MQIQKLYIEYDCTFLQYLKVQLLKDLLALSYKSDLRQSVDWFRKLIDNDFSYQRYIK